MAKIYCNNKEFNGISASVNFVDGVGDSNIPHLISWFQENGYTIIEEKRETSVYDSKSYKELTELAKERGFNGIGLKKEPLIKAFLDLDAKNEDDKNIETEE
ncbi:MAG TPA: hypothetical protein VIK78_13420 [Ruminiclostridium sp.]